ncbi:hypothetical protein [Persicobacter psychrovividus]|uniref:DUF5115 domain-containing protein n=1 Tax=Persicobacter psychrovividus TaxID=387638 RepID=A0ABM7VJA2_9BACT|nr:hypothetical protein PEPS_33350 [Persicobacter psychrovividus]
MNKFFAILMVLVAGLMSCSDNDEVTPWDRDATQRAFESAFVSQSSSVFEVTESGELGELLGEVIPSSINIESQIEEGQYAGILVIGGKTPKDDEVEMPITLGGEFLDLGDMKAFQIEGELEVSPAGGDEDDEPVNLPADGKYYIVPTVSPY